MGKEDGLEKKTENPDFLKGGAPYSLLQEEEEESLGFIFKTESRHRLTHDGSSSRTHGATSA